MNVLDRNQRRVMGFDSSTDVFVDNNPPVTAEDLKGALYAMKRRSTPTLLVPVAQGVVVTIELSEIIRVANGPRGLEIPGDNQIPDWRFTGVVSFTQNDPAVLGRIVRCYAVGGYNLDDEEDIVDLYTQIVEPRA